ncbi:MAG: exodeoxyribonuclease VII small subunit [Acidobacteria bacterium]|nr:MAG: exodeoxyribonuclease VII small subunit [Acidobacteriota bacterium]PIE90035.1 MAG: exodeoxyribonuclease VII small subunit [Acidobacteriota bacterium]
MGEKTSFESQMQKLEELVRQMSRDELSLEEALACYEEGIVLSRELSQRLEQAQQKVENLSSIIAEQPVGKSE